MATKISEIFNTGAKNCKIHPVLYKFYLRLHDTLGAEIVHRRKRTSDRCIEIIFYCDQFLIEHLSGHHNTLPEAEACGFRIICRPQTKKGHTVYRGHRVYQLFITPVHPKKRREILPEITALTPLANDSSVASA